MKKFNAILILGAVLAVAMLSLAAVSDRSPLLRAYLQTDMDGNQRSATNFAQIYATNFYTSDGLYTVTNASVNLIGTALRSRLNSSSVSLSETIGSSWFPQLVLGNLSTGTRGGYLTLYNGTSYTNLAVAELYTLWGKAALWLYNTTNNTRTPTIGLDSSDGSVIAYGSVSAQGFTNIAFSTSQYLLANSGADKRIVETTNTLADLTTEAEFNLWTNGLAGTNYVHLVTNGLAGTNWVLSVTNGLATTNYVNQATNDAIAFVQSTFVTNTYGGISNVLQFLLATNYGPIYNTQLLSAGASSGQVLKWNGTAWVPDTDQVGAGGGIDEVTATNIAQHALLTGTNNTYQWATNYAWQATNDLAALVHTKANTNAPTIYDANMSGSWTLNSGGSIYITPDYYFTNVSGFFRIYDVDTGMLLELSDTGLTANGSGVTNVPQYGVVGLTNALDYLTNAIVTTNGFVDASITNDLAYRAELVNATNNLDPFKLLSQGASSGQVLKWDGSKYAPAADETADLSGAIDAATATNIANYLDLTATNNTYQWATSYVGSWFTTLDRFLNAITNNETREVTLSNNVTIYGQLTIIDNGITDGTTTVSNLVVNGTFTGPGTNALFQNTTNVAWIAAQTLTNGLGDLTWSINITATTTNSTPVPVYTNTVANNTTYAIALYITGGGVGGTNTFEDFLLSRITKGSNNIVSVLSTNSLTSSFATKAELAVKANTNSPTIYSPTFIGDVEGSTWSVTYSTGDITANRFTGAHTGDGTELYNIPLNGVVLLPESLAYLTNAIVSSTNLILIDATNSAWTATIAATNTVLQDATNRSWTAMAPKVSTNDTRELRLAGPVTITNTLTVGGITGTLTNNTTGSAQLITAAPHVPAVTVLQTFDFNSMLSIGGEETVPLLIADRPFQGTNISGTFYGDGAGVSNVVALTLTNGVIARVDGFGEALFQELTVQGEVAAASFVGDGTSVTNLHGTNIQANTITSNQIATATDAAYRAQPDLGGYVVTNDIRALTFVGPVFVTNGIGSIGNLTVLGTTVLAGSTYIAGSLTNDTTGNAATADTADYATEAGLVTASPAPSAIIRTFNYNALMSVGGDVEGTDPVVIFNRRVTGEFHGNGAGLSNVVALTLTNVNASIGDDGFFRFQGGVFEDYIEAQSYVASIDFIGNGANITNLTRSAITNALTGTITNDTTGNSATATFAEEAELVTAAAGPITLIRTYNFDPLISVGADIETPVVIFNRRATGEFYGDGTGLTNVVASALTNVNASIGSDGFFRFQGGTFEDYVDVLGPLSSLDFVGDGANITNINGANIQSATITSNEIAAATDTVYRQDSNAVVTGSSPIVVTPSVSGQVTTYAITYNGSTGDGFTIVGPFLTYTNSSTNIWTATMDTNTTLTVEAIVVATYTNQVLSYKLTTTFVRNGSGNAIGGPEGGTTLEDYPGSVLYDTLITIAVAPYYDGTTIGISVNGPPECVDYPIKWKARIHTFTTAL